MIQNNENKEVCSKCGGKCCKNVSGFYHPIDFDTIITKDFIKYLIDNENVVIDAYVSDDANLYFLRPRVDTDDKFVSFTYGGKCIHLTESGCSKSFEDRPYGCKYLKPTECNDASKSFTKWDAAMAWSEYSDLIYNIITEKYYNKENA